MSEFLDRVLERLSPLEIFRQYVPSLRKSGKSYVGLCPFHAEKTPSFHVDPDRGLYHCFGCGAGGNLITFMMQVEKVDRREAVRLLAERAGLPVDATLEDPYRNRIFTLLELAADYYREALLQRSDLLAYLRGRGLSSATLAQFRVGYAPADGKLQALLERRGFARRDLLDSGLFRERGGTLREVMAGRIVFPILNIRGRVIAFGGRRVDNSEGPKYINLEQTAVFEKHRVLYGIYEGLRTFRELERAVVVEGYLDVLACYEGGVKGAVAPLGTAFTKDHARMLSQRVKEVWLAFDGDSAGQEAARKAAYHLMDEDVTVRVVSFPPGKDPADLLQEDASTFSRHFAHPQPFWVLWSEKGNTPPYAVMRELVRRLGEVRQPLRQTYLLRELAAWTGLPQEVLEKELRQRRHAKKEGKVHTARAYDAGSHKRDLLVDLMVFLAYYPDRFTERMREMMDELSVFWKNDIYSNLYAVIKDQASLQDLMTYQAFAARIAEAAMNRIPYYLDLDHEELEQTLIRAARIYLTKEHQRNRDPRYVEVRESVFFKRYHLREEETRDGQHDGENEP